MEALAAVMFTTDKKGVPLAEGEGDVVPLDGDSLKLAVGVTLADDEVMGVDDVAGDVRARIIRRRTCQ